LATYPYNVVREIRVESSIRQDGPALRPLSSDEQQTVRLIAASTDYRVWLAAQIQRRHQRSLALALLVTLVLHVAGVFLAIRPAMACAGSDVAAQVIGARDGPSAGEGNVTSVTVDVNLPDQIVLPSLEKTDAVPEIVHPRTTRRARSIEHIPNLAVASCYRV
jgi:hypothetical protein